MQGTPNHASTGSTSIHKLHGSTGIYDRLAGRSHEELGSILLHAQSHQLKCNFAEVTRLTHPLGETWWPQGISCGSLYIQQFYFDTHQSANKRQEFASPSENESSDARNGAQECAPTIVQLTTSSTLGSKSACQLGSKVHLMRCSLVGEGEEIIMRWNSESS